MNPQSKIDAAYLREFVAFGSSTPITVAECLHAALITAHAKKEFEKVAHLQLRLFAEMVMSLEAFGAMLLAYSRWDKPGGILGALLAYRPGDVPKFLEEISGTSDILNVLCFPEKDIVSNNAADKKLVENGYTHDETKRMVVDVLSMYDDNVVRGAYNKIKHAGLGIRNPEMLNPTHGKMVYGEDVYLITYSAERKCYEFPLFRVTGEAGIRHADKHCRNIRAISRISHSLAGFVAYFLEHDLLRPSPKTESVWRSALQKRVNKLYELTDEKVRVVERASEDDA